VLARLPGRLLSRCRTDVFDDCAAPRLFVDIVKLPLKPTLAAAASGTSPQQPA
jgi:hypothetical protein